MNKPIIILLPLLFLFFSCTQNQTDSLIYEPAGSADYYINNQSSTDLKVIFITTSVLGSKTDSSVVGANSTSKIMDDGIIGVNPRPEDSISILTFYNSEKSAEPVFTVDPVTNEEWEIIGTDFDDTGYGLTEYEFTITNGLLEKLFLN